MIRRLLVQLNRQFKHLGFSQYEIRNVEKILREKHPYVDKYIEIEKW